MEQEKKWQNSFDTSYWGAQEIDYVIEHLETNRKHGLSITEVELRQKRFGKNYINHFKKKSLLFRFLLQFHNVLIYVLLGSAIIALLLNNILDMTVIMIVVIVNAIIGFMQENKAEKILDTIRNMMSLKATVIRDSKIKEVLAEGVVPGDIVFLQAGDKVPSDLRLIEVRGLRIDESLLTGEAVPVDKTEEKLAPKTILADRLNIAYSGTLVTSGMGIGVVIYIGSNTEIGRISELLEKVDEIETPLLRKLTVFGRKLTVIILALTALVFAIGFWGRGYSLESMLMVAIGFAVAAIPEGLPPIITIILALGVQNMARLKAIIRKLAAVESLGSVTVICSDKTGTLTRNEMVVRKIITADHVFKVEGIGYAPMGTLNVKGEAIVVNEYPELIEIGRVAILSNNSRLQHAGKEWYVEGDPMEGALISLGKKIGLHVKHENKNMAKVDIIPFDGARKFMATLHHDHRGQSLIFVKGAPEEILEICSYARTLGENQIINKANWLRHIYAMASKGYRLLALATKLGSDPNKLDFSDLKEGFVLLALLAIYDPPREEVVESISKCHQAGIDVKMITGDHKITARAIGIALGLGEEPKILTGGELDNMSDSVLQQEISKTNIFARVNPEHKLKIVKALQERGEIVAMTGDGVNDALALKRADIGIAMGLKGTETAKEASNMVLVDDNFATIVHAVEEGRNIYNNLKKTLSHVLPSNGGEAGMVLLPVILGFGWELSITPLQILWVNTVCAITLSLALAFEVQETYLMNLPPRSPKESLLSGFLLWRIMFVSVLLVVGAYSLYWYEMFNTNNVLLARTVAVNALVVGECFYLINCRRLVNSILSWSGIFGNKYVWGSIGILAILQIAFTYQTFMQDIFGTVSIGLREWRNIFSFGIILFFIIEIEKQIINKFKIIP